MLEENVEVPLSRVGTVMNHNYLQYHIIADRLENLQNWITDQIKLHKEKKE